MNRTWIAVLAILLMAARGYCADEAQTPKEFGGIVAGVESISAVVEAVDPLTRAVTLKGPEGNEVTVVCGPEVRNFDQIQKGDKVNIDYSERVKVMDIGTAATPARQESLEVSRAPLGEKPAGVVTAATQILATVEAVNYEKRTVTLKGPQRTLEVEVAADAPNFNMVKVGDTVYIEYTEQVAISVTK